MDGDGDLDLILECQSGQVGGSVYLVWFRQMAGGSSDESVELTTGRIAGDLTLAFGALGGSHATDLLVASSDGFLGWWENAPLTPSPTPVLASDTASPTTSPTPLPLTPSPPPTTPTSTTETTTTTLTTSTTSTSTSPSPTGETESESESESESGGAAGCTVSTLREGPRTYT